VIDPTESPFFQGGGFFLIAGPCVLENEEVHAEIAAVLRQVRRELCIPVIFKASFDKANRATWDGYRGPGIEAGLELLEQIRTDQDLPVLTDIHRPEQAECVAQVCDILQIPAAMCRQTDLLLAAAHTGRALNLKKGQWVSVNEMQGAVAKCIGARHGPDQLISCGPVAITERGTFFGYGDMVVDMRNIPYMRQWCNVPIIFDATHSVQCPARGASGASGGRPQYIAPLARAAVAAGAEGLFIEVHPRPQKAPSDGACMLPLDQLMPLMREVLAVRETLAQFGVGVPQLLGV